MGCNHTEEKPNEVVPEQIVVTRKKKEVKEDNKENLPNNNETLGLKKPIKKSKKDIFIENCLKKHNELRAHHGVKPLKISEDLNKIAQKFAEHLAEIKKIEHSYNIYKGEELGENLFCCSGSEIQGDIMTMSWYDEINKYDFNNPGFISGTGHFTQIIWKDTIEVGFGFAKSSNNIYYGVANYYPAGNINTKEEFSKNVLKRN